MKCLMYSVCSFIDPHLGVMMERAERLNAAGHEVTFAYCDGCMDVCAQNPQGAALTCAYCHFTYRRMLKRLSGRIKRFPIKKYPHTQHAWSYGSLDELKQLQYRGVASGYAALSMYISSTRNSRPDVTTPVSKRFFDHLLDMSADQTDWLNDYLDRNEVDEIHIMTGRMIENRAFFDVARQRGITFYSNEFVGSFRAETDFMPITYKNATAHNLEINREMAEELWAQPQYSMEEKREEGRQFYERRRNNQVAGDRVYTALQEKGMLPDGFDPSKHNIAVFNSSEDEFAAIGKDFDAYQLFRNQTEGIIYLLDNLPPQDYHVYVRIHPNLARVKYDYVLELFDLPKRYPHVTLVPPTSKVSTYALMDAVEKVVVFGSTAGAEATYSGKPVVLLGPSFYFFLDVAYTPREKPEAIRLLKTPVLPAKDKENALKYAYFLLYRQRLAKPGRYFDFRIRHPQFMGRRFLITAYSTLFGSCLAMKLATILFTHGVRFMGRWKLGDRFFHDPVYTKV